MKTCTITSIFPRFKGDHCGAGTTIFDMSRNFHAGHGVDVSVVAPNYPEIKKYEEMEGLKVYRFSYFWPRKFQKLAYGAGMPTNMRRYKLAKIQVPLFVINFFLRAFNVARKSDIIHIHWILNGLIGVPLGMIFRKPMVLNVHRVVSSGKWMSVLIKFIVSRVDYIIFNSAYTRDELLKIAQPKAHCVIPCTIDPEKFKPGERGALRKKLGLSDDIRIIFYVGYLIEKKGIRYLIEAMPAILEKIPNAHLVLGGGGIDLEKLKAYAKELGLEKNVTFLDWVKNDQLPDYYRDADVFVLPSIIDSNGETETLGIVLLEAMACGTPVVGSNVGGIPDAVNPEAGFLAEPKNPASLAEKLILLLSDENKRKQMGEAATKWARTTFSWKNVSPKYMEIYDKVLKRNS